MEDIKNIKEVVIALDEVSLVLVKILKDGLQPAADGMEIISQLLSNAELKAALGAAIEGLTKIPAEIKDLDLAEGLELAALEMAYIPKLVAALKA